MHAKCIVVNADSGLSRIIDNALTLHSRNAFCEKTPFARKLKFKNLCKNFIPELEKLCEF